MKLRKIALLVFALTIVIASCTPDDDDINTLPPRDRTEVYAEDLLEIETFLQTHFYNYEEFDFNNLYDNSANDEFQIVFKPISPDNLDKTPIIDRPELKFKMVADEVEEDLIYKMYYLEVREGKGEEIHFIDKAFVTYEGSTTTGDVFDDAINPTDFELTSVLNGGVVPGFREALLQFKTATNFTEDGDGTDSYHNHGIGAAFLPSGLAYFNQTLEDVVSYTPLIFKFNLYDRVLLDHDNDGIPSFLEDLNDDADVVNDDTNNDSAPNFFDNDDDGDGVDTSDEIELKSYPEVGMVDFITREEAQMYFNDNAVAGEILIDIDYSNSNGTYVLNTFIATDSNGNGTPDYLDSTYPEE